MTLRCYVCRTRRATWQSMLSHASKSGHAGPCTCMGYHFPHRPGSPCCELNPLAALGHARRAGASPEQMLDLAADLALEGVGSVRGGECPF